MMPATVYQNKTKTEITLPHNGWRPRRYQLPLWSHMEKGGRRAVAVWHRRAGKDEVCLHWAACAMMQKPATYWHMLPEAAQARKALWDAVNPHTGKRRIDEAFPDVLRKTTREHEMLIKFKNGSTWQVVGSDNYDSLVGSPPYGVIFSEWPLSKPDAWGYLRPILAENGGWAVFIYTPRGNNHGKATYDFSVTDPDWFGELLTVDDTNVFDEHTIEAERREMISQYGTSRGEALFRQEYYCLWVEAFEGAIVYPEFNQKFHVSPKPLLPLALQGVKQGRSIFRGWDNTGLNPACIITYINTIGQWYWIKEFCGEDIGIVDFAQMVDFWCRQTFPANAVYRDIGDPAGRIRDSKKGSPRQYIYEATGVRIEDGIQTFKVRRESISGRLNAVISGKPALLIDPTECPISIAGFSGGYSYPEIGNTGYFRPEPQKNKYSHIHDAGQYVASIIFAAGAVSSPSESIQFDNITSRYKPGNDNYQEVYTNA
jgi:hypothetical protein